MYGPLLYLVFLEVLELLPTMALRIFDASEHMLAIRIPALHILALLWFLAILPFTFTMVLMIFENLDVLRMGFITAELAGIPLAVFL